MSTPTDFNDLHALCGLEEVKRQVDAALLLFDTTAENSPTPSHLGVRDSLENLLLRYQLTDEASVYDSHDGKLLRKHQAQTIFGKKLFDQWLNADELKIVSAGEIRATMAAHQRDGKGMLARMLSRYTLLYPAAEAWDAEMRDIVEIKNLKIHWAECYDQWIKHPDVKRIRKDNLVFDPQERYDPNTHINTFRGLPLQPVKNEALLQPVLRLVWHLCNEDEEITDFLIKWLAYPLQRIGAKLASAIMMHSETQGTGKSLLFDVLMRPIYAEYGATLGQRQMESQYTDWGSRKLYCLFEEIFSRDQKYSHTGTVKQMVTGATQRIEKKFVSSWEEANHMNAVFLSNEIQPFPVEPSDRRMMVIWPRTKLDKQHVEMIVDFKDEKPIARPGVVEAWLYYLLSYDCSDFHTHTEPPLTAAKKALIDFGRPSWDTFFQHWKNNRLEIPYQTCLSMDLFEFYVKWCTRNREHSVSHTRFGGFVAKRVHARRNDVEYEHGQGRKKGTFLFIEPVPRNVTQAGYLGELVKKFKESLAAIEEVNG